MLKGGALHVWDSDDSPLRGEWTTVLWRHSAGIDDADTLSISYLAEQDADELRARYLGWVYELGQTLIGGKRVIDHLLLRPSLSFWWMTSLAQQFNLSGTSRIDDAIKAMALEKLLVTRQTTTLVLSSPDRRLSECLRSMCVAKNINYVWRRLDRTRHKPVTARLLQSLPCTLRSLIYLCWQVVKTLPLLRHRRMEVPGEAGHIMFIDVLVHLDERSLSTGEFVSNYWSSLVGKLAAWKIASNWGHLFFRHPAMPTPSAALRQVERFNEAAGTSQFHYLLEQSLSPSVLWRGLQDYLSIRRVVPRLRGIEAVGLKNSDLNLWSLHSDEWLDSLAGKEAMTNCLRIPLFEAVLDRFPQQRIGVYISENQPWEMALLSAWRSCGHGAIIGTPHTTVRFWDLRYHHDPRSYLNDVSQLGMPRPDFIAVNGPVAYANMLAGGYPQEKLVEVEALRFQHLNRVKTGTIADRMQQKELSVLVCGDFLAETNRKMLSWLVEAAKLLPRDTVYVMKPHPAYPVDSSDYASLKLKVSESAIAELLCGCDVVFTSNVTSASVDAYCSGASVVQMMDGSSFNMSPLRGLDGVVYVKNPVELSHALRTAGTNGRIAVQPFFFLDDELPKWRRLLGLLYSPGK